MFIKINDDIINVARVNEKLFLSFLSQVTSQLSRNKHFLYFEKPFYDFIKNNLLIDNYIKDFFRNCFESHIDTCAIMDITKFIFEIRDCENYEVAVTGDKMNVMVPLYEAAERIDFLQGILLSENLSDSEFYFQLGERFISQKNLKNCKISCKCRGGGGSEVSNECCNIISERDIPLLCIFDSDRLSPTIEYRNRCYDKVVEHIKKTQFYLSHALMLNSRCIDSIYPYNLVKLSSPEYSSVLALKKIQEALINSGDEETLLTYKYIKLSKNMTLKYIKSLCIEFPEMAERLQRFWNKFLTSVNFFQRCCCKNLPVPLEDPCPTNDHKCTYCIIKSAPNLAKQMKELLENNLDVDLTTEPFMHTVEDWRIIEESVFSFFCTSKSHAAGRQVPH